MEKDVTFLTRFRKCQRILLSLSDGKSTLGKYMCEKFKALRQFHHSSYKHLKAEGYKENIFTILSP